MFCRFLLPIFLLIYNPSEILCRVDWYIDKKEYLRMLEFHQHGLKTQNLSYFMFTKSHPRY